MGIIMMIKLIGNYSVFTLGNWAQTDFAVASKKNTFVRSNSANRDMLIAMHDPDVVSYYKNIFEHDRNLGTLRNCLK